MMGFHPSVSYRPIPGLVALFTRGHRVRETLEHLTHAPAQPQAFYTDVVKSSMEHRNFNGNDNRGGQCMWFGGVTSGYGGGQGSMFGYGGFPPANNGFHPGHVDQDTGG
jgi:hypothetical protein